MRFQENARLEVKSLARGSNLGSFYKLSVEERLRIVQEFCGLSDEEVHTLKTGAPPVPSAQRMIENVVGFLPLPLGIAVNFFVNDKDYLIPMAIEEPSVVAGASHAATMAEAVAPMLEKLSGGNANLRIISNLADRRIARATAHFSKDDLGGGEVVDGIVQAYAFAAADPYRCATHNKGVMNGVTAVCLATGNDTRAIEAGAHAYAARTGHYSPLTRWSKDENGDLEGFIEIPAAVGIVGGITSVHPAARISLKILRVKTAKELGEVMAAVRSEEHTSELQSQ